MDDETDNQGTGTVAAGSTVSATLCHVIDKDAIPGGVAGDPSRIEVDVLAPKNGLTVVLSNSFGQSVPVQPAAVSGGFEWKFCGHAYTPGPYPAIPNSNGGVGLQTDWTLSITAGSQSVRSVFAVLQEGGFLNPLWVICPPYGA